MIRARWLFIGSDSRSACDWWRSRRRRLRLRSLRANRDCLETGSSYSLFKEKLGNKRTCHKMPLSRPIIFLKHCPLIGDRGENQARLDDEQNGSRSTRASVGRWRSLSGFPSSFSFRFERKKIVVKIAVSFGFCSFSPLKGLFHANWSQMGLTVRHAMLSHLAWIEPRTFLD